MTKDIHIADTKGNVLIAGQWIDGKVVLKTFVADVNNKWFYYGDRYYKKPSEKKIKQAFLYICKKVEEIDQC